MDGRQGWGVVLGAFLTLAITAGVNFFVTSVLLEPITLDTGWTVTQVSTGITIWGLMAALLSPFLGHLIDRYGARRMMLLGCLINLATTFLLSRVTSLWQFYAILAVAPIGAMLNTFIPVAAVVAKWFIRHRGIATGIAMLGLGVGGAIAPLVAAEILDQHTWRETYAYLSLAFVIAMIPVAVFIRNPDPEVERVYAAEIAEGLGPQNDLTFQDALRTRSFWGLSVGDMLTGVVFNIFNVQLVLFLTRDYGDADNATKIFSLFLLMLAGGTLVFGPLADRFSMKPVLVFCYTLPAVAMLLLFPGTLVAFAFAFAVLAGLAGGGRSAIFPVAIVYCFGETNMAAIYGLSNMLFMLGNAAGPAIGGYIYDSTGSTTAVYAFCVVTLMGSASLVSLIRRERP